jgi:hypothetical protein
MVRRGPVTRFMGLWLKEESPVRVTVKGKFDRTPMPTRAVVPLLAQSTCVDFCFNRSKPGDSRMN